ncbi:glycosyltransferase [Dysgonomonas sp. 216]|uniref:glycosyltransferase family 4 protein n=1 Tax=Dysgonomonas sp. 216 TaxID=2302934 RepID=UPI0013D688AE|nr:glycosyltransferase family 4 protein [Dysgonomonas sp. 216]NDW17368.1 glycosyltransferase [Dysgonomonas sp. 216]
MKILQINKYFYPKGGAETVFFNTIDLLKDNGHTVIPFSVKSEKNRKSEYESYFVNFSELSESGLLTKITEGAKFLYNKNAATQLDRLLSVEKPDIAHIHLMFNSFSVSILPVLRKHRIPVIMTAHDYRLVCPSYTITNGKGDICERCLETKSYYHCVIKKCSNNSFVNSLFLTLDSYFRKYCYRPIDYIDRFIFVSHFSRNKHIQGEPLFKDRSTKLYNFTLIEEDKNIEKEDYILYFGRISEEKGIATLIKAMKNLPIVNLKVLGEGPLLNSFKQQELPSNIEFLGFKTGNELRDYVQKAKYVVLPSECYENNPMTIIEAMTLGTPVIGSNLGGIPELITDSETGFLFQPKSADDLSAVIERAMSKTQEEYERLSASAKEFAVNQFSAKAHFRDLMNIYKETIENYKY